jgi:hypothetical protein
VQQEIDMNEQQQPDSKPGAYYVSAIDGPRKALILGPFIDDHAGALAMVEKAREKAEQLDNKAFWYAYGTCRVPTDGSVLLRAGVLNRYFDMKEIEA